MKKEDIKKALKENKTLYHKSCKTFLDLDYGYLRCPDCHRLVKDDEVTLDRTKNE